MKNTIRTLAVTAGLLAASLCAQAQNAFKIIVVDMAKVYDTHYKTEEANAKFSDAAQRAQEQFDALGKQIQDEAKAYEALKKAGPEENPAWNDQKRQQALAKHQEDLQQKIESIQRLQNEAQTFRANTQRSLQQRAKNHRDLIMDEIMKVVNDIARAKGATLVLDKSGPSVFGVPVVLAADPSYDITEEVVKEVNKDRPPAPAAPAPAAKGESATTPPVAAPAPAGGNAGGFTVPNVTGQPKKP